MPEVALKISPFLEDLKSIFPLLNLSPSSTSL